MPTTFTQIYEKLSKKSSKLDLKLHIACCYFMLGRYEQAFHTATEGIHYRLTTLWLYITLFIIVIIVKNLSVRYSIKVRHIKQQRSFCCHKVLSLFLMEHLTCELIGKRQCYIITNTLFTFVTCYELVRKGHFVTQQNDLCCFIGLITFMVK